MCGITRDYLLNSMKNIVEKDGEFILEPAFTEGKDGKLVENYSNKANEWDKCCALCIHHMRVKNWNGCSVKTQLDNWNIKHAYSYATAVKDCDAYTPLKQLQIIHSKDEMLSIIELSHVFFSDDSYWENYYGFELMWDEETGDVLENVYQYDERGGIFRNIPDKYPSVINLNFVDPCVYNEYAESIMELQWIYIGNGE